MAAARQNKGGHGDYIAPMLRRAPLACLLALVLVATATAAGPTAHAAKACSLSSAEQGGAKASTLGPTYVLELSAKHVSCGKAKRVVKAFHACRYKKGKTGHCARTKGYACSEHRTSSPTQYDASVTCTKGSKSVKHTYTQNT